MSHQKQFSSYTHTRMHTYRASACLPVISISPLRAMKVSLPQQRKIPEEKWGRPKEEVCMLHVSVRWLNQQMTVHLLLLLLLLYYKYFISSSSYTPGILKKEIIESLLKSIQFLISLIAVYFILNLSTETPLSVCCQATCSQWDTALLLLACDWTDAVGNILNFRRNGRERREASNTTHLNWTQRQVTNKAGAILDETVWTRRRKISSSSERGDVLVQNFTWLQQIGP